jgi:hypothetical protein
MVARVHAACDCNGMRSHAAARMHREVLRVDNLNVGHWRLGVHESKRRGCRGEAL